MAAAHAGAGGCGRKAGGGAVVTSGTGTVMATPVGVGGAGRICTITLGGIGLARSGRANCRSRAVARIAIEADGCGAHAATASRATTSAWRLISRSSVVVGAAGAQTERDRVAP